MPLSDDDRVISADPKTISPTGAAAGAAAIPTSHPIGFWFFFWGELAERSSYYGMRGILFLYMTERLAFKESNADLAMHAFIAAATRRRQSSPAWWP